MDTTPILRIDESIDIDNPLDGILRIVKLVRPDWILEKISHKIFDNGITNKMFGIYSSNDKSTMMLVRVNGKGTELFLERNREIESFELLHKYGCAPSLYCVFKNGMCYEYIQGETVSKNDVKLPRVYRPLTEELVRMHSVPYIGDAAPSPTLFAQMRRFLGLAFAPLTDESTHNKEEAVLHQEIDELEKCLTQLDCPVVFCHNDILLHNIIFNSETGTVKFIDYEYASFNYQAFDIGNHFCEFAGLQEIDYSLYPSKEFQLNWLHSYLVAWYKHNKPSTSWNPDKEVEELYKKVNKFALASHMHWGVWGLVQARYSKLDFDYKTYAQLRLNEYYKRKEEFLSL